jgi:hypothetical protein
VIDQGGAGMKWKDRGKDGVERWTGSISCEKEQRTAGEENLRPKKGTTRHVRTSEAYGRPTRKDRANKRSKTSGHEGNGVVTTDDWLRQRAVD